MADPVQTVTTPAPKAAQSAVAAGAAAAAQTVVTNVKADVKAEGAHRPWVLVAAGLVAGVVVTLLAVNFLHILF